MINKFCITTLTHNAPDRALALKNTILSFMNEYHGGTFEWFIVINVTNEDINQTLEWAKSEYGNRVKFNIHINEVNNGPGGGINQLNNLASEYEYQLFIEGDWMVVPDKVTGSGDWVHNSIKLLDQNPEIDQIHYRRYLDDLDDRQYGFAYWVSEDNIVDRIDNGSPFLILKNREYTNNPSMKRMSKFYETGILPLREWNSDSGETREVKGNPEWGRAELDAMGKSRTLLNAAWLEFGNFVHHEDWKYEQDWDQYIKDDFGCNVLNLRAHNKCKYGYLTPGHFFCAACDKDETISDIVTHNDRYIQNILPVEHQNIGGGIEDIYRLVDELVKNPMIDARSFIDVDTYFNKDYIRKKPTKS